MARHRKHRRIVRRRHYGDGPSGGGTFEKILVVAGGVIAAQWIMALLPVTPAALLPAPPPGPYSGLRYLSR
jgi:hypothetical protein